MTTRKRLTISIGTDSLEKLKEYAAANHFSTLSGAVEQLIWESQKKEENNNGNNLTSR